MRNFLKSGRRSDISSPAEGAQSLFSSIPLIPCNYYFQSNKCSERFKDSWGAMSGKLHSVASMIHCHPNRIATYRVIFAVGLSTWIGLFVLEILPDGFLAKVPYLNATLSFSLLAALGFTLIRFFPLGTLEYFGMPQMRKPTMVAISLVTLLTVPPIFLVDRESKSLSPSLLAIFFLFSVGLGEEIFSRGFHYGFLEKFGRYLALVVS